MRCGIVGLPNVGKSTLFNALGSAKADAANYPFCTIEPNIGVFEVPDPRLEQIANLIKAQRTVPATVTIVDIAGIVRGASKGEGLGNQFLHHIREVDAIVHLVRCFENDDIVHVEGSIDPKRDIDVIDTELMLADLQAVEKRLERAKKTAKSGDKDSIKEVELLGKVQSHLDAGNPVRTYSGTVEDFEVISHLCLLTQKPVLYVANTSTNSTAEGSFVDLVKQIAGSHTAAFLQIDSSLEAEISELAPSERKEYLSAMGLEESGLSRFIRAAFDLLGLTTYYTAGVKEARAWVIPKGTKAPQAAGVIHSDFEKGFICAECYKSDDLLRLGSEVKLKEAGLIRQEGKQYTVSSGDVLTFRFNV